MPKQRALLLYVWFFDFVPCGSIQDRPKQTLIPVVNGLLLQEMFMKFLAMMEDPKSS